MGLSSGCASRCDHPEWPALAGAATYFWQMDSPDTACSTTLEYKGVMYTPFEVSDEIIAHDDLGNGIERGCGWKGPWKAEIGMSRIAGVDPRTAVVTPIASNVLYVAEDFTLDDLPSKVSELVVE